MNTHKNKAEVISAVVVKCIVFCDVKLICLVGISYPLQGITFKKQSSKRVVNFELPKYFA